MFIAKERGVTAFKRVDFMPRITSLVSHWYTAVLFTHMCKILFMHRLVLMMNI